MRSRVINNIVIALIILNTVCIGLLCFRIGRRIGAKEGIDYCFYRMQLDKDKQTGGSKDD